MSATIHLVVQLEGMQHCYHSVACKEADMCHTAVLLSESAACLYTDKHGRQRVTKTLGVTVRLPTSLLPGNRKPLGVLAPQWAPHWQHKFDVQKHTILVLPLMTLPL